MTYEAPPPPEMHPPRAQPDYEAADDMATWAVANRARLDKLCHDALVPVSYNTTP